MADLHQPDEVKVRPSPQFLHPADRPFQADAVFWSVSAIEKILAPYQVSVYGDEGAEYARRVLAGRGETRPRVIREAGQRALPWSSERGEPLRFAPL